MTEFPELTVSVEDADVCLAARRNAESWRAASDEEKRAALRFACLLLESAFEFSPDALVVDAEGRATWRPRIVAAVCEQALWSLMYDAGALGALRALGVTKADVGGIAASFDATRGAATLCSMARALVGRLGTYRDPDVSGGFTSTPLAL